MPFSPCIARFKRSGDRWLAFTGRAATEPLDALQLVIEAPEFLGLLWPARPMPRAAMVVPGLQSNRVLVVVDEVGGIQLAVCPDPSGGLGAVVGELLAASGKFWHQKSEALAGPFEEFLGMTLADWIAARVGEGWSPERFRAGLDQSLGEGRFPIAVVIDKLDDAANESLQYLRNMNLQVRVVGYTNAVSNGDEVVRPRLLAPELSVPPPQAIPPPPRQAQPQRPAMPQRSEATFGAPPQAGPDRTYRDDYTPTVGPIQRATTASDYGPLPASNATPKQKEILNRLVRLDELGLPRRGFEYFLPGALQSNSVGGTIVIAVDPDRWPFPKVDEVIVVVNTGPEYLAAYLGIAPSEIEEFLASLPRAERKEHKGALLLRASKVGEAAQLANELKALKEVSIGR